MTAIRPIEQIAAKWATVTPQRTGEYQAGAETPLRDWKQATAAAAPSYVAGMQASLQEQRWNKAVNKATTDRWKQGVLSKGVSRWGQGVQLAAPDFNSKFAPFVAAIRGLNLPPRFARRDPRNLDRVKAVVDTMIATAKAQNP